MHYYWRKCLLLRFLFPASAGVSILSGRCGEHAFNGDHFLADFQTEEDLQSHLTASYQRAVAEGIPSSVCAQNMIMAIKSFLKIQDTKEKEVGDSMWMALLLIWKFEFLLFWANFP